jgi:hypothetical protein
MLYRAIALLKDYSLIDADSSHAEHFTINKEGLWQLKEYKQFNENIFIEHLHARLPTPEIYNRTKL